MVTGDLLWDDVKCFFDPDLNGVLPDVRVVGASIEDWQSILDLVKSNWPYEYSVGDSVLPLPTAEAVLSRTPEAETPDLRVWVAPDMLAIFRPYAASEIDFDVDIREVQGQERLDLLCDFLTAVGRHLGKSVLMAPEGEHGEPVLGFEITTDRVIRMAEPW